MKIVKMVKDDHATRCPICFGVYTVFSMEIGDQSHCPNCRVEGFEYR